MSINGWINTLMEEERLYLIEPVFDSDEAVRTVLVSPEINALLDGPWPSAAWEARGQRLRADLESIASGGEISVCTEPFKALEEDFGLLDPPESGIWDFRSRAPAPGLRLLGCFIEKDKFVALIPAMRSQACDPPHFVPRGPLGNRNSTEWRNAIRDTATLFRSLFQPYEPIRGDDIHAVLSGNYNQIGN